MFNRASKLAHKRHGKGDASICMICTDDTSEGELATKIHPVCLRCDKTFCHDCTLKSIAISQNIENYYALVCPACKFLVKCLDSSSIRKCKAEVESLVTSAFFELGIRKLPSTTNARSYDKAIEKMLERGLKGTISLEELAEHDYHDEKMRVELARLEYVRRLKGDSSDYDSHADVSTSGSASGSASDSLDFPLSSSSPSSLTSLADFPLGPLRHLVICKGGKRSGKKNVQSTHSSSYGLNYDEDEDDDDDCTNQDERKVGLLIIAFLKANDSKYFDKAVSKTTIENHIRAKRVISGESLVGILDAALARCMKKGLVIPYTKPNFYVLTYRSYMQQSGEERCREKEVGNRERCGRVRERDVRTREKEVEGREREVGTREREVRIREREHNREKEIESRCREVGTLERDERSGARDGRSREGEGEGRSEAILKESPLQMTFAVEDEEEIDFSNIFDADALPHDVSDPDNSNNSSEQSDAESSGDEFEPKSIIRSREHSTNSPSNESNRGKFFRAIKSNNKDALQKLIDQPSVIDPFWVVTAHEQSGLVYAVDYGRQDLIRMLIPNGDPNKFYKLQHINAVDKDEHSPLYLACAHGLVTAVKDLLRAGALIHQRNSTAGSTCLLIASQNGNLPVVKVLLGLPNIKVDLGNYCKWTPLMAACQQGRLDVVKLLVQNGANIRAHDSEGLVPLFYASKHSTHDQSAIVSFLLSKGANVNSRNLSRETSLMAASEHGFVQVITLLLKHGAKVNACSRTGETALMFAIGNYSGDLHQQTIRILLEAGADVFLKDQTGSNCLDYAKESKHKHVLDLVKDCSNSLSICPVPFQPLPPRLSPVPHATPLQAPPSTVNISRPVQKICPAHSFDAVVDGPAIVTPPVIVAKSIGPTLPKKTSKYLPSLSKVINEGNLEKLCLALEAGADCNAVDKNGNSPLILACTRCQRMASGSTQELAVALEILNTLLDWKDLNIDAREGRDGTTVLYCACVSANYHIGCQLAAMLLSRSANINHESDNGACTPVMGAAFVGNADLLQFLLSKNANPNMRMTTNMTAILHATNENHIKCVKLLLENNADASIADEDGWMPFNSACSMGHIEIVQLLLNTKQPAVLDLFATALWSIKGPDRLNALEWAIREKHDNVVALIEPLYVAHREYLSVLKQKNSVNKGGDSGNGNNVIICVPKASNTKTNAKESIGSVGKLDRHEKTISYEEMVLECVKAASEPLSKSRLKNEVQKKFPARPCGIGGSKGDLRENVDIGIAIALQSGWIVDAYSPRCKFPLYCLPDTETQGIGQEPAATDSDQDTDTSILIDVICGILQSSSSGRRRASLKAIIQRNCDSSIGMSKHLDANLDVALESALMRGLVRIEAKCYYLNVEDNNDGSYSLGDDHDHDHDHDNDDGHDHGDDDHENDGDKENMEDTSPLVDTVCHIASNPSSFDRVAVSPHGIGTHSIISIIKSNYGSAFGRNAALEEAVVAALAIAVQRGFLKETSFNSNRSVDGHRRYYSPTDFSRVNNDDHVKEITTSHKASNLTMDEMVLRCVSVARYPLSRSAIQANIPKIFPSVNSKAHDYNKSVSKAISNAFTKGLIVHGPGYHGNSRFCLSRETDDKTKHGGYAVASTHKRRVCHNSDARYASPPFSQPEPKELDSANYSTTFYEDMVLVIARAAGSSLLSKEYIAFCMVGKLGEDLCPMSDKEASIQASLAITELVKKNMLKNHGDGGKNTKYAIGPAAPPDNTRSDDDSRECLHSSKKQQRGMNRFSGSRGTSNTRIDFPHSLQSRQQHEADSADHDYQLSEFDDVRWNEDVGYDYLDELSNAYFQHAPLELENSSIANTSTPANSLREISQSLKPLLQDCPQPTSIPTSIEPKVVVMNPAVFQAELADRSKCPSPKGPTAALLLDLGAIASEVVDFSHEESIKEVPIVSDVSSGAAFGMDHSSCVDVSDCSPVQFKETGTSAMTSQDATAGNGELSEITILPSTPKESGTQESEIGRKKSREVPPSPNSPPLLQREVESRPLTKHSSMPRKKKNQVVPDACATAAASSGRAKEKTKLSTLTPTESLCEAFYGVPDETNHTVRCCSPAIAGKPFCSKHVDLINECHIPVTIPAALYDLLHPRQAVKSVLKSVVNKVEKCRKYEEFSKKLLQGVQKHLENYKKEKKIEAAMIKKIRSIEFAENFEQRHKQHFSQFHKDYREKKRGRMNRCRERLILAEKKRESKCIREERCSMGAEDRVQEEIQCNSCGKWRRLPSTVKASRFDNMIWMCQMNDWDIKFNDCLKAQEKSDVIGKSCWLEGSSSVDKLCMRTKRDYSIMQREEQGVQLYSDTGKRIGPIISMKQKKSRCAAAPTSVGSTNSTSSKRSYHSVYSAELNNSRVIKKRRHTSEEHSPMSVVGSPCASFSTPATSSIALLSMLSPKPPLLLDSGTKSRPKL